MGRVEDVINARKKSAQAASGRVGSYSSSRRPRAPIKLSGFSTVTLDPKQMERACLLPYIKDKGASNAYMLLRTRLLQRMREHGWKSLIVTGTLPGDGKSTTAINLAIGASQDVSQGVLLVDVDMQRPALAKTLGIERSAGLSDYLAGKAEWKQVIYNTDMDRLAILPNFEPGESGESLASPKMLALLDYIKRIDPNLLIVFDMPPVLASDDVLAFGPHVDSLLFVIAEGRTSRSLLQRANEMLEGIPRVGTVLNRSSEADPGYY